MKNVILVAKEMLFIIFVPVIFLFDILFKKEQFRARIMQHDYTARMTFAEARQQAALYGKGIRWSRAHR